MKTQCKEPTLKLDRFGKRFRRPKPQRCSYADLEKFTDSFSEENFIGKFQFGKVFRGDDVERLLPTPLIVKIWDHEGDNEFRLRDELMLLQHEAFGFHPGLVKLYKYCCEGDTLAIVYLLRPNEDVPYALKPIGTVANLVLEDSFTWLWRIKVALWFAFLVKLLHGQNSIRMSLLVRNISAAHIMLDVDYNPTLFDFGMVSGGIFPDRTVASCDSLDWCYGYIDPKYSFAGGWSEKSDVFAFGVLLLMLITKRVHKEKGRLNVDEPFLHQWAQSQYTEKKSIMGNCSLVHHTLEADPDFVSSDGPRLTKIAMQCVEYDPSRRPTMKQVVSYLLNLGVVQDHARDLGLA